MDKRSKKTVIGTYVRVGLLAIVLFTLSGLLWPVWPTWGVNAISVLPLSVAIGVLALVLLLTLSTHLSRPIGEFIDKHFTQLTAGRHLRPSHITLLSVVLFAVFFLLRSRNLLYGDAASIVAEIQSGVFPEIGTQYLLQIGTVVLMHIGSRAVSEMTGANAMTAFSAIVALWGVIGSWALISIIRLLTIAPVSRLIMFIAVGTSGAVLLFFGHLENYTPALAAALWSLYWSLRIQERSHAVWWAILAALIACTFHLIVFPFFVTALLAYVISRLRNEVAVKVVRYTVWGAIGASAAVVVGLQLTGYNRPFVPPWPLDDNPYSLFSSGHLIDVLNLLVLHAAAGIVFLVASFQQNAADRSFRDHVLLIVSVLTLLAGIWIDPTIGAARDFDLLAIFGFPLALLGSRQLSRVASYFAIRDIMVPCLLVGLVVISPLLIEQLAPAKSAERLHKLMWNDPHYSVEYKAAYRCLSWGVILGKVAEGRDFDVPYFRRRLKADPGSSAAASNLADHFAKRQQFDSAAFYYGLAMRNDPSDAGFAANYAFMLTNLGRFKAAIGAGRRATVLDPTFPPGYRATGIALMRSDKPEQGIEWLRHAYRIDPQTYENIVNMGIAFLQLGVPDSALHYLHRALPEAPRSQREQILVEMIRLYRQTGQNDMATKLLQEFRSEFPQSTLIERLE